MRRGSPLESIGGWISISLIRLRLHPNPILEARGKNWKMLYFFILFIFPPCITSDAGISVSHLVAAFRDLIEGRLEGGRVIKWV